MFKTTISLVLATLLFVVVGTFLTSSAKAAADCPTTFDDAVNNYNWGVNTGGHTGDMAGLIVHAYDATTNNNVTVTFHLHSGLRPYEPPYPYQPYNGQTPNGNTVDLNDRIFHDYNGLPSGFENDPTNRTHDFASSTLDANNNGCEGWDAFGPSAPFGSYTGNGQVLDCGPNDNKSRFWFTDIRPTPIGDGANGQNGYWSIHVHDPHTGADLVVNHFTEGSMSYLNNWFSVSNGFTTRVDLIWHPTPQQPPSQQAGGGLCTSADATNDSTYYGHNKRVHVQITGATNGHITRTAADKSVTNWYYNNLGPPQPNQTQPGGAVVSQPVQNVDDYVPNPSGENTNGNVTKATWYYQPDSPTVTITMTTEVNNYPGHPGWWAVNGTGDVYNGTLNNCFAATACDTTLTVDGDGPDNVVLAGGSMYVSGTYRNIGQLDLWNPALVGPDGAVYPIAIDNGTGVLHPGESVQFNFLMPAPPGVELYNLTLTPNYFGTLPQPPSCPASANVPIYQAFNVQPDVNINNTDEENPTTVTYTAGGHATTGTVTATTTSWLTKQPFGGAVGTVDSHTTTDTYTSAELDHNYTYNNPSINAGDNFCAHVTISPASGYGGPPGYPVVEPQNFTLDSNCVKTVNKPYTQFLGSDVSGGGGFGTSCPTTSNGSIYAYNEQPGKGGSGAQFGAEAMDVISGLSSATLRANTPTGPNAPSGLAFANNTGLGGSQPTTVTGGSLGPGAASNFCVPDYFSDKSSSTPVQNVNTATVSTGASSQQWYKPPGGTLTLNGTAASGIANGTNQAIFVDGNVEIKGDIKYSGAVRGSVKDIPSFYLIVKNGNIHIDPVVKQLDGIYVAQPDTTSAATIAKTGIINTCWLGNNYNQIYNQCKFQLTVNGAFVADRVLLARSYSSLRYSQNAETPTTATHSCGNAGKDTFIGWQIDNDCAAEIFNFSPDIYMTQPNINPRFGPGTEKYDAITSLSPVL